MAVKIEGNKNKLNRSSNGKLSKLNLSKPKLSKPKLSKSKKDVSKDKIDMIDKSAYKETVGSGMGFFRKIKEVIFDPKFFFEKIQAEYSFKEVLKYYFLMQMIILPFGLIPYLILNPGSVRLYMLFYLIGIFIGIFVFFAAVLLYSLLIMFLGGSNGILRTYQAFVYGSTPGILLSWLPVVNLVAYIYSMYLTIIGIIKLQDISKTRAVVAYFVPFLVFLLISLLVFSSLFNV